MNKIEVTVYGKPYTLTCNPGEERHLRELAVYLDRKVRTLSPSLGAPELDMMVLTSLVIADELNDASREVAELRTVVEELTEKLQISEKKLENSIDVSDITAISERITVVAEELEKL